MTQTLYAHMNKIKIKKKRKHNIPEPLRHRKDRKRGKFIAMS
jgi:hypothetical protein